MDNFESFQSNPKEVGVRYGIALPPVARVATAESTTASAVESGAKRSWLVTDGSSSDISAEYLRRQIHAPT